jgi:hypothetical protein
MYTTENIDAYINQFLCDIVFLFRVFVWLLLFLLVGLLGFSFCFSHMGLFLIT